MAKVIFTENAPAPIGPYNQAIQHNDTVYVSGQIAINPATGNLEIDDLELETDLVLDNDKREAAANDEAAGQAFERAGALDGESGLLDQSSQSMQQAKRVSFVDLDVSLSLMRCSLKVVSDFKPVFDMQAQYDRVFSAFAK